MGGAVLFDQQKVGGGEEAENPLMLIVGSGLTPQSD